MEMKERRKSYLYKVFAFLAKENLINAKDIWNSL